MMDGLTLGDGDTTKESQVEREKEGGDRMKPIKWTSGMRPQGYIHVEKQEGREREGGGVGSIIASCHTSQDIQT